MRLAKGTTECADEKGTHFYENVLNFENGSINVIARRSVLTFMSWRYECIWRNYSHLPDVIGI
jgi:hypothetical protein